MIKKLIITKLLFTLLFLSITAKAALHWNVAAYIWTGTAVVVGAASMVAAAPIVIAGAAAVGFHAGVIGLYWDDSGAPANSSGQPTAKGMSVIIDPNQPLVTPPDWTAGDTGNGFEPTPPEVTEAKFLFSSTTQIAVSYSQPLNKISLTGKTLTEVITALTTNTNFVIDEVLTNDEYPDEVSYFAEIVGVYADAPPYSDGQPRTTHIDIKREFDCDDGYTIDFDEETEEATCQLIEESQVKKPSDDVCEVRVNVGKFMKSANDPDCSNTLITGGNTSQLQAITPTKSVYLVTSATNEVTVYEKSFDSANNKTITNIGNFGATGVLNYLQTVNSLGNTVSVNPVTGSGSGGSGGSSTLPEGAAKDSSLNAHEGGDGNAGDNNATGGTGEVFTTPESTFATLKAWTVPTHSGSCPATDFTVMGKNYNFNAMCTLLESSAPTIQYGMTAFFSVVALLIVLGA